MGGRGRPYDCRNSLRVISSKLLTFDCNSIYSFTGNEEPTPGMSYIEFDINKHTTDLLGLYRYVAAKVHRHHFVGGLTDLEIPRYVSYHVNSHFA